MSGEARMVLDDGLFHFQIKTSDGEKHDASIDVLTGMLIAEECQSSHNLAKNPETDRYVMTAAFLQDLAQRFRSAGVEHCTETVARILWESLSNEYERIKKNASVTLL